MPSSIGAVPGRKLHPLSALAAAALLSACPAQVGPPTASAVVPATAHVGVRVALDGSLSSTPRKSGAAPAPLHFHWSLASIPAGSHAAIDGFDQPHASLVPDLAGAWTVQLVVDDGTLQSPPQLGTITAAADCTPAVDQVSADTLSPAVGQEVQLSGRGSSPCNAAGSGVGDDPIVTSRWSVVSAPDGSLAVPVPRGTGATFTPDLRGTYRLGFQVTDALGAQSDLASPASQVVLVARGCGDNLPEVRSIASAPDGPAIGAAVQLSAVIGDADADAPCSLPRTLSRWWALTALPAGSRAQLTDPSADSPQFTPDVGGSYVAQLTVTDQLGRANDHAKDHSTVTVAVSACGGALPLATITAPAHANAGDVVQLVAGASDGDALAPCSLAVTYAYAWSFVAAPIDSAAQLGDAQLQDPSFTADRPGTYTVALRATASTGMVSATAFASIEVGACGSFAPTAAIVAPAGGATGVPVALSATIVDDNSACGLAAAPYYYEWRLAGVPSGSAARLSGSAGGTSPQVAPSFVPDRNGDYAVALTVTDQRGRQAVATSVHVTVARCNAPLTAAITGPAGVGSGALVTLQGALAFPDPNDPGQNTACTAPTAPLAYAWTLLTQPAGALAALSNPAAQAPSFTARVAGPYVVRLIVTDAAGNTSPPKTFTVQASTCSALLTATPAVLGGGAGPGTPVITGAPAQLSAGVLDPNDPALPASACTAAVLPLSYAWSMVGAPPGSRAILNNPSIANPSLVPDVGGSYQLQVTVTDAAGNQSPPSSVSFSAADCRQALSASLVLPAHAPSGSALQLSATVLDANTPGAASACAAATAPLSYVWTLVGRPAASRAAVAGPFSAQPTLTPDLPGNYDLSLSVSDAAGNRAPAATGTLLVDDCTAAPAVSILATSGSSYPTLAPIALATSAPSAQPGSSCASVTPLAWRWTLRAPTGSAARLTNPTSGAPSFTPDLAGNYQLTVLVTDALGNSYTSIRTIAAFPCALNAAVPLAIASLTPLPASAQRGQPVTLSAQVAGDNSVPGAGLPACGATAQPLTYAWTLQGPAGSTAALGNPQSPRPVFVPDQAGAAATWQFGLTVTDALGFTASKTGSITVALDCAPTVANVTATPLSTSVFSPVFFSAAVGPGTAGCATPLYFWSFDSVPTGSRAPIVGATAQQPGFVPDVPNGKWTVRLAVTDPTTGARATATTGAAPLATNSCGSQAQLPLAAAGISQPFPIARTTPQPDPNTGSSAQYLLVPPQVAGQPPAEQYLLQFDGSLSSDPSAACASPPNNQLAYRWSVYARPVGSLTDLYPLTAARPVFTPDVVGDYIFKLVVTDGRFTSAPSYSRITVEQPLKDFVFGPGGGVPVTAADSQPVKWNDLELDPNPGKQTPAIAYYQLNASTALYDLKYTACTANCATTGGTWTAPEVIEAGILPANAVQIDTTQVALKFVPNGGGAFLPAVSYRDTSNCQMKYAVRAGSGATAWQPTAAASRVIEDIGGGCGGVHGEIQLGLVSTSSTPPGTPAVAYHSHNDASGNGQSSHYAVCTANCTNGAAPAWTIQTIEFGTGGLPNNPGHYTSLAVDPTSHLPRVSYADDNGGAPILRVAFCADGAGANTCDRATGTWTVTTVEPAGNNNSGWWTSMGVTKTGTTAIAYQNKGTGQVLLATCATKTGCSRASGAAGAGIWQINVVEPAAGAPALAAGDYFTLLQLDSNDLAHITWIDSGSSGTVVKPLRYVIQKPGGGYNFRYFNVDTNVTDGHSSFILTPSGSTHVSYALTNGLKYYPFGD